jgi:hypothetical protein
VLIFPPCHVEPDFADDGLGDADVDPVDPGEIDAADAACWNTRRNSPSVQRSWRSSMLP